MSNAKSRIFPAIYALRTEEVYLNTKKAFKENRLRVVFVFLAFAVMVVIACFFVSSIIRNEAKNKVMIALHGTEQSLSAHLRETRAEFDKIYIAIQDLLDGGKTTDAVSQYLLEAAETITNRKEGIVGFMDVYGYIHEEIVGSTNDLDDDYIPQQRPWYQLAVRSEEAAYTAPYFDYTTGKTIMSLTQKVYGKSGNYYGVLSLDLDTSWLMEYVDALEFTEGGYGLITNQFIYIIAHPQEKYINVALRDYASGYAEISDMLRTKKEVSAKRIVDIDGAGVITFFVPLYNEWYLGIVMPVGNYYADLYFCIIVLSALGLIMALILSGILFRISDAKIRSEEENRIIMSGIRYASKIQRSLLPKANVFENAFSEHTIAWKPRDVVGGDIYWSRNFDDGTVLCVCDCTGHGTPGALLTMLVVSTFDTSITDENHRDTADILLTLDHKLATVMNIDSDDERKRGDLIINDGCDLAVLFIAKDGSVAISSGHIHVFVCDGKTVTQIKGQRIYVGEGKLKSKDDVNVVTLPANPDNKYYIATDGLFEQPGGEHSRPYGYNEFRKIILDNHGDTQASISGKIWAAFEEYRGKHPRTDDFQLITFKI